MDIKIQYHAPSKTLSMVSGVIHGITDESYPSKYHGQTVLGVARHCQK
ncbi:TPA: hypothetical protein GRI77_17950 [Vibrio parahaemolyticus]|nr:hypothetical protein [Vibrio parahaemolyticus]EJU8977227.1 hypothetical protein [Vibrio parahaemolyticus]EJU9107975.1 hypothetical protein [Vibrio parahaemolyticus]ELC2348639.1 hypothetical protein [Vibrio parahaemolyticus]HAS6802575.1 hypothetical protein [Vibrio parahaemolyticus]HAS6813639.1 hypothetical protein [Vibrio parahaemolyticus]